jgi:uracil-DNA glycosylase
MSIPFDEGYASEPFASLVMNYPGDDIYPQADFRTEWGPVFHRGRLDGTARVLVIGQDPAQHEVIVRRSLVGAAGKRVQGFLRRLGIERSYVAINTFLYSVYGQGGGSRNIANAPITAYRNRWIGAILDTSPIEVVVGFGGLAKLAWQAWLESPGAQGRAPLHFAAVTHPTWPESSGKTALERAAATRKMLKSWSTAQEQLASHIQTPDDPIQLLPYGEAFIKSDLPDIPAIDLPAGTPVWMQSTNAWATRKGTTQKEKRRTIVVKVPALIVR